MNTREFLKQGIILINKQTGRTSHDEVAIIKHALRHAGVQVKVGHSGTLDPKVTGLLVVGIGAGTRLLEYMLHSEKRYIGELVFHEDVPRKQLDEVIEIFTGKIDQLPPRKSSVKRQVRTREVYGMKVLSFDEKRRTALLECAVERGTYIRKLFHDMGEHLGVRAHMGELHRTHVGPFSEDDGMITSDEFKKMVSYSMSWNPLVKRKAVKKIKRVLLPIGSAVPMFGKVILQPGVEKYIASGSNVFRPGVFSVPEDMKRGDIVGVYTQNGELVVMGYAAVSTKEHSTQEKGVTIETHKVLI